MTQPVHEPTQGRFNQGATFRSRQLFRRPSASIVCSPVTNSDYAAAVIADSPELYWQMQDCYDPEGFWVCVDSSGNGNDSDANVNMIRQRAPGPLFTGTDDSFEGYKGTAIATAQFNSTLTTLVDDFTIEGFVRVAFDTGRDTAEIWQMGPNTGTAKGWFVEVIAATRKFRYVAAGVGNGASSAETLVSGCWYHIAVVRESGTWTYYVNGQVDTANAGVDTPGTPQTFFLVEFGGVAVNQAHVAYYQSPLSAGDISTHFGAIRNT